MSATAMAAVGPSLFTHKTSPTTQLRLHSSLKYIHLRHHLFKPISISSPTRHLAMITPAAVAEEEAVLETEAETEKEEKQEEEGDEICTKLYFGNLPYHCDSAQLAGIVEQYANPELIEVLYNRDTGRSRGFAFVTMSSVEDCNAIIENLDGSEYGGRYLRVNFADKPRKREPLFPETEHKLFIGNLSWSVTSDSLYQAFRAYGNIVGARVLYDGETGKSRGYGFVCYATRSEMENALASLNGMMMFENVNEGEGMNRAKDQFKRRCPLSTILALTALECLDNSPFPMAKLGRDLILSLREYNIQELEGRAMRVSMAEGKKL